MNKFQFLGRLTKDPEVRVAPATGNQVTSFSVAVNRRFASPNGERQTDFFNLTAFGKIGEFCSKYFKKGKEIVLSGEMQSQRWTDTDGNNRISWVVQVSNVDFCGSKSDSKPSADVDPNNDPLKNLAESNGFEAVEGADDDLPF